MTKPYNTAELMARVKSQLRRYFSLGAANGTTQSQDILKNGGLLLNRNTKELLVDGEPVRLTATEYKIMELLMEHPGYVFSAEEIYSQVWQEDAYSVENTVMVHIRRIREKIEITPKNPKYLKNTSSTIFTVIAKTSDRFAFASFSLLFSISIPQK